MASRKQARRRSSAFRRRTPTAAFAVAIVIAGLIAYSNSFAGVFVFDDEPAIVQNTHIKRLWPLTYAMSAPEGTTVSGRPVVSLSLALNYSLAPEDVRDVLSLQGPGAVSVGRQAFVANLWGYHALNLAIHLAAALGLFGVMRRTLASDRMADRFAPQAASLALATTLLWTVHPLQTAAVTYVVQRAESLMGLFVVVTLYCAIRAWNGSRWWMAGSIAACALGMGTKETMVAAPVVVMLWDWMFGPRERPLRERAPLYSGLAATWLVLALLVSGNHRPDAVGFGFAGWPWWRYLITQSAVITHYLRLALVPFALVLDYDWPAARLADVLPQLLLISSLVVLTIWAAVRQWSAGFAGAAFFLMLAPTSSVLPIVTEVAAEHRMYIPLAAVLAVMVVGTYDRLRGWAPSNGARVGFAATLLLASAESVMTYARNADYHDFDRIWLDTITRRPQNARARNNYATSLLTQGRFSEAEEHARVAVRVDPKSVEAQQTIGVALCAMKRCIEGIQHLQTAAALSPDSPDIQRNLGEA